MAGLRSLLLPVILGLTGLGAGLGAGWMLKPEPAETSEEAAPPPAPTDAPRDFVRLSNQFIVPVVQGGEMRSLVILSLSLEVPAGSGADVLRAEPKLRDLFLQVLFDHANAGGFSGEFTSATRMGALREALREAARQVMGAGLHDVLIVDLVRQDS